MSFLDIVDRLISNSSGLGSELVVSVCLISEVVSDDASTGIGLSVLHIEHSSFTWKE